MYGGGVIYMMIWRGAYVIYLYLLKYSEGTYFLTCLLNICSLYFINQPHIGHPAFLHKGGLQLRQIIYYNVNPW